MPPRTKADTAAIIVAGGQGTRFGGSVRKQFLNFKQKPLVWWSLTAFENAPSIGEIILVVPMEDVGMVQTKKRGWGFSKLLTVVAGGSERYESVRNGLRVVPPRFSYVAVHDAVRPLVSVPLIESVIKEAREEGSAIAALPSRDTIKESDTRGFVTDTPARSTIWLAHTPQVFEKKILEEAHTAADKTDATDDAQLVERIGRKVKLVPSYPENIKVTVPSDIQVAQVLLKIRKQKA